MIRRAHCDADTVLLTTGLAFDMEGCDLADLYFRRWPIQENAFKEAGSLGLSEHRGNCGRIIANVDVILESERLESRAKRAAEALAVVAGRDPAIWAERDRKLEVARETRHVRRAASA